MQCLERAFCCLEGSSYFYARLQSPSKVSERTTFSIIILFLRKVE